MTDDCQKKKIAIVGAGALGKLIAATLMTAGHPVTFLVKREEQVSSFRKNGLTLQLASGQKVNHSIEASLVPEHVEADMVIITVKSYDTESAARTASGILGNPRILSLQNGLGNSDILLTYIKPQRLLMGLTTYGATTLSDYEVAGRGEGELVIGFDQGRVDFDEYPDLDHVPAIFSEAGWNVRTSNQIEKEVWKKALINIGINAITAIHGVTNGEVYHQEKLRLLAVEATQEAVQVSVAAGFLTEEDTTDASDRMLEVCRQTANNRSSMLQDIDHHRQTEIQALNGYIVRLAEQFSISVPVNQSLVNQVLLLERD